MRLLLVLLVSCKSVAPRPVGTRAEQPLPYLELAYDGKTRAGWTLDGPLNLKSSLVLAHAPLVAANYEGVVITMTSPIEDGDLLEVRVDSAKADVFPRVRVGPRHRRSRDQDEEIVITMAELNPKSIPFDRIVLRALAPPSQIAFQQIGLVAKAPEEPVASKGVEPRLFAIDCFAKSHPISPLIYGIALNPRKEAADARFVWRLNPTTRRWGGNPASRYNWEIGAWNTAADYFFKNVNYTGTDYGYRDFLRDNFTRGVSTALTLPMIGWVAKDTHSVSFPTSIFGAQRAVDPEEKNAGDGYSQSGKPLQPLAAERTSVQAGPQFIARWVQQIRRIEEERKTHGIAMYQLDNEPDLWHDTHRDVHPAALTYDELVERTISYGEAVRKADKDAKISGPGSWGWTGYFYSAADAVAGLEKKPDRLAHGDLPLLAYYLKALKAHEDKTGSRIVDLVDVHYYPAGRNVFGDKEATDPITNALRIRSTRALWDGSYVDESWIKDTVRLIPRVKEWIAQYYPGRGVVIGEWNFGAEHHMSGALALAETLGRFGEQDVAAAYYWTYPPAESPAFYAFSAYRNYDGQRATFLDNALATRAPAGASLFASRNGDGSKITAVLLNFSPTTSLDATIDVGACGAVKSRKTYIYNGQAAGFAQPTTKLQEQGALRETIPPYSITVLALDVAPRSPRQ